MNTCLGKKNHARNIFLYGYLVLLLLLVGFLRSLNVVLGDDAVTSMNSHIYVMILANNRVYIFPSQKRFTNLLVLNQPQNSIAVNKKI